MSMRPLIITILVVFLLDQATKFLVVQVLDLANVRHIDVWSPYLTLQMAWNRGVNFGLFSGTVSRWFLIAVAIIVSAWVFHWMRRDAGRKAAQISAGLLIGGAIGNVFDRLIYGAVADFLNMSCCGIENPYAFNVADIAIFVGAAGLILFTSDEKKTP